MSTAWYMVDDDDNVAIIEYNENGPVPWDVPEGEGISSLLFGPNTDEDRLPRIPFAITEEQVDDFLSDLSSIRVLQMTWNDGVATSSRSTPHELKSFMHAVAREGWRSIHRYRSAEGSTSSTFRAASKRLVSRPIAK